MSAREYLAGSEPSPADWALADAIDRLEKKIDEQHTENQAAHHRLSERIFESRDAETKLSQRIDDAARSDFRNWITDEVVRFEKKLDSATASGGVVRLTLDSPLLTRADVERIVERKFNDQLDRLRERIDRAAVAPEPRPSPPSDADISNALVWLRANQRYDPTTHETIVAALRYALHSMNHPPKGA